MDLDSNRIGIRLIAYFMGLFILAAGIAISVKASLGVSPVSSIPYTMTCVLGIEMGNATILFHIGLVVLQMLLLRKDFKWINLMQIVIGIIFGKFTTICNSLVGLVPTPDDLIIRIGMALISTVLVAAGIFIYMPANIMPLAVEGVMQAVEQVTHIEFAKIKIGFDISMVVISLMTCLAVMHGLGSVGLGTIIAAFLVGTTLGIFQRYFGEWRDNLLDTSSSKKEQLNAPE